RHGWVHGGTDHDQIGERLRAGRERGGRCWRWDGRGRRRNDGQIADVAEEVSEEAGRNPTLLGTEVDHIPGEIGVGPDKLDPFTASRLADHRVNLAGTGAHVDVGPDSSADTR